MPVPDRVRAAVEPAVTAAGLVLEGVDVTPAGARRVVRVVVDLPEDRTGGLDLDEVAVVSRAVSAALDADDAVLGGAPYVLEVSTPGVSRPLTERRHWARARTRLVTAVVAGAERTGRVVAAEPAELVWDVGGARERLAWSEVGAGRVQVELSRPPGHPDDEPDEPDEHDEHDEQDGEG